MQLTMLVWGILEHAQGSCRECFSADTVRQVLATAAVSAAQLGDQAWLRLASTPVRFTCAVVGCRLGGILCLLAVLCCAALGVPNRTTACILLFEPCQLSVGGAVQCTAQWLRCIRPLD
jgi:hypothetical protein